MSSEALSPGAWSIVCDLGHCTTIVAAYLDNAERARMNTYHIVLSLLIIVFDLIAKEEQMVSSVKYLCKASYIEM